MGMGGCFLHSGPRYVQCETKLYLKFELGKKIDLKESMLLERVVMDDKE